MPKSKNRGVKHSQERASTSAYKHYFTRQEVLQNSDVIGVMKPLMQNGREVKLRGFMPNTSYKNKYSRLNKAG